MPYDFLEGNRPRWYGLSCVRPPAKAAKPPSLVVEVWSPVMELLSTGLRDDKGIELLKAKWRLGDFESDLNQGFGFNGAMKRASGRLVHSNYHGYVLKPTRNPEHLIPLAVSLGLLFQHLNRVPVREKNLDRTYPADPVRQQLMTVYSGVSHGTGPGGSPVVGSVAPVFLDWVARERCNHNTLVEVPEMMAATWLHLDPDKNDRLHIVSRLQSGLFDNFSCRLADTCGGFSLGTFGNACGVATADYWNREPGKGLELEPHNVDSPMQQLSLIAGLAAMHQLADDALYPV